MIPSSQGGTCQNSASITVDATPPVITCPADVTVECDESTDPVNTGTATATDCDPAPSITYSDVTTPGDCPQAYTIVRTWTATDCAGNSVSCSQTIIVEDNTAPVWDQTMPADVTAECDAVPVVPAGITATDNCDAEVDVTYSEVRTDGTCLDSYTLTRTWTATDNCGNSIQHVQVITIQDTKAPVWDQTMPADVTAA